MTDYRAESTGMHRPPVSRRRGRWATVVHRYGWRAYALPVLSAVTVAALLHGTSGTTDDTNSNRAAAADSHASHNQTAHRPAAAAGGSEHEQVEGATSGDAGFAAGSTPAPIVVNLGDDATSCATNSHPQLVLVSISKQHLWACEGHKQVTSTAVTTGRNADHDQTPLGSWRVQARERDRYLVGPGYRDYVKYWVPFNGDFGFHDASWQTMPFGSKDYTVRGSHGCVHLPLATMAWLYRWAKVADTVVTVET